jgi:hypothetical protein
MNASGISRRQSASQRQWVRGVRLNLFPRSPLYMRTGRLRT